MKQITPALIMDMYSHMVTGKQVRTYFKLQLPIFKDRSGRERYEIIDVDIEIPQVDIQSRRVSVGKKILIERLDKNHIRYLGPEGDWETMMQYGIAPDDYAKFDAKFHGFSESETSPSGIEYIEEGAIEGIKLTIKAGEVTLGTALITPEGAYQCRYNGQYGKKLLIDYCRPRGINFPMTQSDTI